MVTATLPPVHHTDDREELLPSTDFAGKALALLHKYGFDEVQCLPMHMHGGIMLDTLQCIPWATACDNN